VRRPPTALLLSAALALAGCGGGAKPSGPAGGAEVVPRSSAFLIRVNTDFGSPGWTQVNALLKSVPAGARLVAGIVGGADLQRDVKPALGPETDLVALTADDARKGTFLGLTQPKGPARLDALLTRSKPRAVSEQVGDWRVISERRGTIDRFKQARNGGSLSGLDTYRAAVAGLPEGALARVYVDGAAVSRALDARLKTGGGPVPGLGRIGWVSAAATAEPKGIALELRIQGDEIEATPFTARLPAEVPAGVSLYVGFKGLDATLDELRRSPALTSLLGSNAKLVGALLADVVPLFKGEGALYVRPAADADDVYALVLKVDDEAAAEATLGRLATLAGAFFQNVPQQVQVAGVAAHRLRVRGVTLYYAVFGGKVVVTNAERGIRELAADGGHRLAGSKPWRDARAAAGMPDETTGILYADLAALAPLIGELRKGTDKQSLQRDLAPFGPSLLYGSVDGSVLTVKGFASVR
jgi:hypothetical protein